MIVYGGRDADAAGRGQRLKTRRDIDPVTQQVIALDHHVAQVHADPEAHTPRLLQFGVALFEIPLELDRTAHCLNRASEFGDHAVTGTAEHAAIVLGDQPADSLAVALKRAGGCFFIRAHHPAVADDIGG